ncbi:MAG: hypothetical protein FD169_237 [Bacillota bacterium]|nr:MAG: hypothetical protein FD169_237 [Bacillota bacterium]
MELFRDADSPAPVQNILLAATGLGLGSVWLGVTKGTILKGFNRKFCVKKAQLPSSSIS